MRAPRWQVVIDGCEWEDKAPCGARPSTARPARSGHGTGGIAAGGMAGAQSFSMYAGSHPLGRGAQRSKSPNSAGALRLSTPAADSARKALRQPAVQVAMAQAMWELLGERAAGTP